MSLNKLWQVVDVKAQLLGRGHLTREDKDADNCTRIQSQGTGLGKLIILLEGRETTMISKTTEYPNSGDRLHSYLSLMISVYLLNGCFRISQ